MDALESEAGDITVEDTIPYSRSDEERDEVREMEKLAAKDTSRIRFWRFLVIGSLLVTGAAVTASTYILLLNDQHNNFVTAVSIFVVVRTRNFSQIPVTAPHSPC